MYKDFDQLILYKNFDCTGIIGTLSDICKCLDAGSDNNRSVDDLQKEIYGCIHNLLKVATDFNFDGNLWHDLISYSILTDENPFSLTCERVGGKETSVFTFALKDMERIFAIFNYDIAELDRRAGVEVFSVISDFKARDKNPFLYNNDTGKCVRLLSEALESCDRPEDFLKQVVSFYETYGTGMIGANRAFRLSEAKSGELLIPVGNMDPVVLSDIVGYDLQKEKLVANTESFIAGKRANNVLLYGDSGTGKSTSIKALVNEYYDRGLRLVEVKRHQFKRLSELIAVLKKRNFYFLIFLDDLSFEENETEYKFLKAVIEGGVETKPDNILIYATSNRRHLVKELWSDKDDVQKMQDVHRSDSVEEKLSLYNRFGLTIGFFRPDRQEYYTIVKTLAHKAGIEADEDELLSRANVWALRHGGMSGRTAEQFVRSLEEGEVADT